MIAFLIARNIRLICQLSYKGADNGFAMRPML
jgi:hypothetical protein